MTDRDLIELFNVLHQGFTLNSYEIGKAYRVLKGEAEGDMMDCLEIIAEAEEFMNELIEHAQVCYEASDNTEVIGTVKNELRKLVKSA